MSSAWSTTTTTGTSFYDASPVNRRQQHPTSSSPYVYSLIQLYSIPPSNDNDNDAATDDTTPRHRPSHQLAKTAAAVVASTAAASTLFPSLAHAATSLPSSLSVLSQSFTSTGFYQAFSLVFLSELGDKTFFIAGLLAMKTSRWISFVGSISALAVMTVLSVLLGQIFHAVPPGLANGVPLDDVCAVAAFLFFGVKILSEALQMQEGDSATPSVMDEELQEAKETVAENQGIMINRNSLSQIATIFGLVFAAELGDRSFLSTIALSAAQAPVAVAVGAVAAHAVATGIAVVSGAVVAKYLSERVIGIIGGSLFLVFAVTTAVGIF